MDNQEVSNNEMDVTSAQGESNASQTEQSPPSNERYEDPNIQ